MEPSSKTIPLKPPEPILTCALCGLDIDDCIGHFGTIPMLNLPSLMTLLWSARSLPN